MRKVPYDRLLWTAIMLATAMPLSSAQACTIVWNEKDAKHRSDAVVWGTYQPSTKSGVGTIEVSRREKGPKVRALLVSWDVNWVNDGANCPVWQPDPQYPRGRFFLRRTADGAFTVDAQTPAKKAKR